MEQLLKKSQQKIDKTSLDITRYLLDDLRHKDRISIIKGARVKLAKKLVSQEKH